MSDEWEDAPSASTDEWEDAPSRPFKQKAAGALDAAAAMFAGTPAQIAGGVLGLGTLLSGQGLDKANETLEKVQKSNFGLGEYKPVTEAGAEYAETVSNALEKPVEWAGAAGEKIAGNEGRLAGELWTRSAMELIDPLVIGGVAARGMMGRKPKSKPKEATTRDTIREEQAAADAAKTAEASWEDAPDRPNLTALETDSGQMSLFDIPESGRMPNPTEAVLGDWRVDENGIPIKADLSMEAANTENILQKNLWGDELARKHEQEAVPLTQAIDSMPDLPWKAERDAGIELLKHEIEAPGELKAARLSAETGQTLPGPDSQRSKLGDFSVAKGQRGAINPEVFKEGFQKLKQLADGTWLRAYSDGRGLTVEARKDGHILAESSFDRPRDNTGDLQASWTGSTEKGLSKELYLFASELGNDISPSMLQTDAGRGMWDAFEKRGLAQGGRIKSPGNKQMGALRVGEKKQKALARLLPQDKNMIPADPNGKAVVDEALNEGKDSNQWKYTESGGSLAAMKRASAAVLGASRIIQNAGKRAELQIRRKVFPVEQALRGLKRTELTNLADLMKDEMFSGKRFDGDILARHLSTKELQAYQKMRELFDDTLRIQNEARAAKGQKPITEMEAYLSSRWEGDFRRPVFQAILDGKNNPVLDEHGNIKRKLVWYLAAHSKGALEAQWNALHKKFPDLTFDPKEDHTIRYYKRQTDLQSSFSTLLDILDRNEDHPAILKIINAIKEQAVGEGASFLGQEKHFKEKAGVRGFVGDRPEHRTLWGLMSKHGPKAEALAMFQQQIQYAKNAYKWSELQVAAQGIKEIVSDPRLVEQQPNNVKYIKEYYKNAVGYGEATAIAHLEDSIRNLGLSPAVIGNAIGNVKTFFILQKLAVSAGYTLANFIQTLNVAPHLMLLRGQGFKGNPLTSLGVGIPAGIAMATGHYMSFLNQTIGGTNVTRLSAPGFRFWEQAFKYAEDNGVTARSIYDESPIETSFSATGRVANLAGKTMSIPESFVRSMAYSTFVQFLKESGKFTDDMKLYQKAEELVNASMVDYRAQERPMMFSKMGIAGDFLNTLQTYPTNWYNQWNLMGREAMKGNIGGLVTMFALQYAVAGAMGIPGFYDMEQLYTFIKDNLPAEYWVKAQENDFFADPKLWMVKNFGEASVYGVLSDQTGLGMTSRVASPGMGQMLQSPVGPTADIAKQVYKFGSAVVDPTNKDKWAESAMASVPTGPQGLVETAPVMEGTTFERRPNGNMLSQRTGDVGDHRGLYERTPEEVNIRKWGFRSQKEVLEREVGWQQNKTETLSRKKAVTIIDSFYAAVKRGDVEKAKQLNTTYAKLTGNGISSEQVTGQAKENFMTSMERSAERIQNKQATTMDIIQYARMKKVLEEVEKARK
jgi:hypothetical protein